jgi:Flp pilus assembly protein protease CpaA
MEEYYFLLGIGLIWTLFAVVQDLKTREISNWLNFSLVVFALGYRGFYSLFTNNWDFFLLGLAGFGYFFVISRLFYYAKIFAGGDAKLFASYGALLPYGQCLNCVFVGAGFIFLLFAGGIVWTLIYSIYLARTRSEKFKNGWKENFKRWKFLFLISLGLSLVFLFLVGGLYWVWITLILFVLPLLYIYVKAMEVALIVRKKPEDLGEGDWLEKGVRVNGVAIETSVHGLSRDEIRLLRRAKKSVLIKEGVPFAPAFLIALIVMGLSYLVLGFSFSDVFSYLF